MVFIWMLQHCWRCSVNDPNKTLDRMILAALSAHKPVNRFRQCLSTWDSDGVLKQRADSILFGLIHASCYDSHLSSTWWPRFVFGLTVLRSRTKSALSKNGLIWSARARVFPVNMHLQLIRLKHQQQASQANSGGWICVSLTQVCCLVVNQKSCMCCSALIPSFRLSRTRLIFAGSYRWCWMLLCLLSRTQRNTEQCILTKATKVSYRLEMWRCPVANPNPHPQTPGSLM